MVGKSKKKAPAKAAVVERQATPVVLVAYDFDDEAIDSLIDLAFRLVERMTSRPDVIRRAIQLAAFAARFQ